MTNEPQSPMTPAQFDEALARLRWKQSDFCRKAGVDKNTPSRWSNGITPIPAWVPAYLGLLHDIQALHAKYLDPKEAPRADAKFSLEREDVDGQRA
jgi:transcriptional regulator with XRE-family HTH domain